MKVTNTLWNHYNHQSIKWEFLKSAQKPAQKLMRILWPRITKNFDFLTITELFGSLSGLSYSVDYWNTAFTSQFTVDLGINSIENGFVCLRNIHTRIWSCILNLTYTVHCDVDILNLLNFTQKGWNILTCRESVWWYCFCKCTGDAKTIRVQIKLQLMCAKIAHSFDENLL